MKGCSPFTLRNLTGGTSVKSSGKYVDRSPVDLTHHQQSDWLISSVLGKINITLLCFILCTGRLEKEFSSIYNHQQIISANCLWWIVHHQWDVSWQYSDNLGLLCLCRVFSIEPKHIWHLCRSVWSRFGLKREHFDTEKRYMMLLLAARDWSIL